MKFIRFVLFICVSSSYGSAIPPTAERISGGSSVLISQFPFATALLTPAANGVFMQSCGGAILTSNSVVSAASCFNTNGVTHGVLQWRARVGSNYANTGGTVHIVREIVLHPDYDWTQGDSDIAVLRLSLPVTFSSAVGPGAIAGTAYALNTYQPVAAIGWGQVSENGPWSTELRYTEFWMIDQQTCRNRYGTVGFSVSDSMLCAGWLDVGVRAQCEGDTGSPLLHGGVIVGVYSRTAGPCAEGWFPGVNTKMAAFTNWVVATALSFQ